MKTLKEQKANDLADKVYGEITFAVDSYVSAMTTDMEHNRTMYEVIEKDWKKYASRINTLQKLVYVSPFAFRDALAEKITALSKQTKEQHYDPKTTDNTNKTQI